jgi:predicted alpha/beta hydrolase family esterase
MVPPEHRNRALVTAHAIPPEGPRYGAPLVYLAGAWTRVGLWRGVATYLAHRGWQGFLIEPGDGDGIRSRAEAVARWVTRLDMPPVIIAHDAGALVAAAAARVAPLRALVLVAPLLPGAPGTHAVAWSRGLVWSLLRGRRVPPPRGPAGDAYFAGCGVIDAVPESARLLGDLARRRALEPCADPPTTLVVHGALDPIVSAEDAGRWAAAFRGEVLEMPQRAHWPMAGLHWQDFVRQVHRWLVRQLGEDLLELYAEAMDDSDAED